LLGTTSMVRIRLSSTSPSICPGALMNNGTVPTSSMVASLTRRRLFTPMSKA
jgi:hypothetical protein